MCKAALEAIADRRHQGPGPYHRRRHHRQSAALPCRTGWTREVDLDADRLLPVFRWLAKAAGIARSEMLRTFNCGIGLVAVVATKRMPAHVIDAFQTAATRRCGIGQLVAGSGEAKVVYRGAEL